MNKIKQAQLKKKLLRSMVVFLLPLAMLDFSLAAEMNAEDDVRGVHNGKLLTTGDFTVELAIFEQGTPPEYRAWAYLNGNEISPDNWTLNVDLTRLGGEINRFNFNQVGDYLRGEGEVTEPHSFDVFVRASYQGRSYQWEYESYEGRMQLSASLSEQVGIRTQVAGAGVLSRSLLLYGKTSPDPQQVSHVMARYPGLIRSIGPALGDTVVSGEIIATVEANSSLQTYEIRAPINGIVVEKHANPGEMAGEATLLTIANYDNLWVDLTVFPGDASQIKPGLPVYIRMNELTADSTIRYLNPGQGSSPVVIARVPLGNPDLNWSPGLLVEGEVQVEEIPVSLMIDNRALQTFRDWQVVFIKITESPLLDTYEIRPLTLGRTDGVFTEVLEGLNAGDSYVVENSYLIKADLEKDGATHDH